MKKKEVFCFFRMDKESKCSWPAWMIFFFQKEENLAFFKQRGRKALFPWINLQILLFSDWTRREIVAGLLSKRCTGEQVCDNTWGLEYALMVESAGVELTQHLHGLKLCIPRKSKGILKKVQKTQESVNQLAHTQISTVAGSFQRLN